MVGLAFREIECFDILTSITIQIEINMQASERWRDSHGDLAKVANTFLAGLSRGLYKATRNPQELLFSRVPEKSQKKQRNIFQSKLS